MAFCVSQVKKQDVYVYFFFIISVNKIVYVDINFGFNIILVIINNLGF